MVTPLKAWIKRSDRGAATKLAELAEVSRAHLYQVAAGKARFSLRAARKVATLTGLDLHDLPWRPPPNEPEEVTE